MTCYNIRLEDDNLIKYKKRFIGIKGKYKDHRSDHWKSNKMSGKKISKLYNNIIVFTCFPNFWLSFNQETIYYNDNKINHSNLLYSNFFAMVRWEL